MTEDFNKWWNSDGIAEENSYREGSPVFWAWEGWQAAMKEKRDWQGLTDDEIKDILDCGRPNLVNIKKAEQKLKEKNT
jgi:hypothetical protein